MRSTYKFIGKLGSINIKKFNCYPKYLTYFDEFKNEDEYKIRLENYLKVFRHKIQGLPFKLPTRQSRQAYLNSLYDELLLTEKKLYLHFNQVIIDRNKCISIKIRIFKYCFPRFLQKKYFTIVRQVYKKIHFVYFSQKDIIENAIEIIKISASNDDVELKIKEVQISERFKTDLSSHELSFLFYQILEKVSTNNNFNRSKLSEILANNFSTKRTLAPQSKQIKKHFFDINYKVRKRVEKMFFELSGNEKSN